MSEAYVSRLEDELAALRACVQTVSSPAEREPSVSELDEELAKARATYSDDRLARFEKALEARFAASGGYDSDLERESAAAEGMPSDHERAVRAADARKRAEALASERSETAAVDAPFETQNAWMDAYRYLVCKKKAAGEPKPAPVDGVENPAARTAAPAAFDDAPAVSTSDAPTEPTATAVATASTVTTVASVAELDAARAAVAATRARACSSARAPSASFLGAGAHGDGLPRPDVLVRKTKRSATVPRPPSFLSRDASRAKTIAQQRLEQDLAVEAALQEAELRKRFTPKPVPRGTAEPRFTRMVETERARREWNRETRMRKLIETERPFSFTVRDKAELSKKADPKSAEALEARRANTFQRRFVAKAIPKAVKELRLPLMEAEAARRKAASRLAAEFALEESKMPERMAENVATRAAAGESSPASTPADAKRRTWSFQPAPRKPVPDFDALHAAFSRRLKEAKQSRPSTVVREFRLREKSSPRHRAEPRDIEKDTMEDENALAEARRPFASPRAPVGSTPPPSFERGARSDLFKRNETLATKLRRQAVLRARASGHYATEREREALELAGREAENRRRAAARARTAGDGRGAKGPDARADVAAEARRERRSQFAEETVERVLVENKVYAYVEEGL